MANVALKELDDGRRFSHARVNSFGVSALVALAVVDPDRERAWQSLVQIGRQCPVYGRR